MRTDWNGKPYYSLDFYLAETFGRKVYKLALDGGNELSQRRDGTVGVGGCIFCSEGGSGEFAAKRTGSLKEQIESAKALVSRKIRTINLFTSPISSPIPIPTRLILIWNPYFRKPSLFRRSAASPSAQGPTASAETIRLLSSLNRKKPVWVELGLQTSTRTPPAGSAGAIRFRYLKTPSGA